MVRVIESSAQTLERLLSDILDLSRVESGRIDVDPQPFDLAEIVQARPPCPNCAPGRRASGSICTSIRRRGAMWSATRAG
jgi:hypothetical protein